LRKGRADQSHGQT